LVLTPQTDLTLQWLAYYFFSFLFLFW